MSPRSTKRLHQLGDGAHLVTIDPVVFQRSHLGRQLGTPPQPAR